MLSYFKWAEAARTNKLIAKIKISGEII
jgi:hypothetical protein